MLFLLNSTKYYKSHLHIPVVDLSGFINDKGNRSLDCKNVVDSLKNFGLIIVKDPRTKSEENNKFLDLMEQYFAKRAADYYAKNPVAEIFPQLDYQVGVSTEFTERVADHQNIMSKFKGQNASLTPNPAPYNANWRYLWNIGEVMPDIPPNKSPADFPQFEKTMNDWGSHMINACNTVAEMTALGLGLEKKTFTTLMNRGPHKLAPTGTDLTRHQVGTVLSSFHYDFNFLTIHGKSRYSGLYAWLRTGEKFSVSVPQGHLLLQAGKQFQWLTGGFIQSGFHEVIYTQKVKHAKNQAVLQGKIPWRVSSTLFSHIRGDVTLQPIAKFRNAETQKKYPPILASEYNKRYLQERKSIKT